MRDYISSFADIKSKVTGLRPCGSGVENLGHPIRIGIAVDVTST